MQANISQPILAITNVIHLIQMPHKNTDSLLRFWCKFFGAGIAIALIAGCVGAPIQEMSDARQALKAAQDAGARVHAPKVIEKAEQHLENAVSKLKVKAYQAARVHAIAAKEEAIKAHDKAVASGNIP